MQFFMNDDREYSPIIEKWIRKYNESEFVPPGLKIIFDGYGELDSGGQDTNSKSYAVFIHETSIESDEFPEHEDTFGIIHHRPKEECCIYCWYDEKDDNVTVIPFEDNNSTEMPREKVTDLIYEIDNKYYT